MTSKNELCHSFFTCISSTDEQRQNKISEIPRKQHNEFRIIEETKTALKSLDTRKACGPDIGNEIFHSTNPVKSIFQTALKKGVYPKDWKMGRVSPVFKGGIKQIQRRKYH